VSDEREPRAPIDLRDRDAVGWLYQDVGPALRSFLAHYLGHRRAGEDVLQETFLELWRKPSGFDPARGSIRQYLFGIARRRAAQWHRDNPAPADPPSIRPGTSNADETEAVAVRQALQDLEADVRALLWLREVEGYSYAELATTFDVPVGTIRSRLFSARMELRRAWRVGRLRPAGFISR
jgi:RNA polymerase sigma factor (sigma-70 family)